MLTPDKAKVSIVINSLITLITAGLSLVVLLIAPLGLASVITLTVLIGAFTFVGGLLGDMALFWVLKPGANRSERTALSGGRRLPPIR